MYRIWVKCHGNAQNMINMWQGCSEYGEYVAERLRIWEYVAGKLRIWVKCDGNAQNMRNMCQGGLEYGKYVSGMLRIWEICGGNA